MLGLDVSKDHLVCTLLDPATRQMRWEKTVPNTAAGVGTLLKATPEATSWVLEPTGRYSLQVAQQAQAAGRTVLLAPPQKAKAFLASLQSRAKTDRLDSRGLALYALSQPLLPYPVKTEAIERLEQFLTARKGISQAIARLQQQLAELPHAAAPLRAALASLKEQKEQLDQQITAELTDKETFPAAAELDAVPGIGVITAASVSACLTAKAFRNPDQFVAYVGLDVAVRQSGRRHGTCGLTRQGNAELRRLLYLAAQANLRCTASPFKQQYERERAKGLSNTAALCAVARKLARLCWSLVKHGTKYDAERVHRSPQAVRNSQAEAH